MNKVINLFFIIIIILFIFNTFNYYLSNKNIKNINFNRLNINKILKSKTTNLIILKNDTENIIEFNSLPSEKIKNNEPRNYWNLLKSK